MKTIEVFEFKDLDKDTQLKVWNSQLEQTIEDKLHWLNESCFIGNTITEGEYYKILGCSKFYAETTAWFVPSCYYENNQVELCKITKEYINNYLFTCTGNFIQLKN